MRKFLVIAMVFSLAVVGCGGRDAEKDPSIAADPRAGELISTDMAIPATPPIDLGDVDSGITIRGELAAGAASATVSAEYLDTQRGNLSMATITVEEPFPERLPVSFTLYSQRPFIERPVVVRVHAFRDDQKITEESAAWVMGKDARVDPVGSDGQERPRQFSVDVLAGLDEIPETLLVHARADAWLMEEGTTEELLDPKTAQSGERVTLMSNPVRINFKKSEQTP
ncbi:MAG: hypothetical protein GX130_04430 [Candidatus Hydrogenedens sp.]|jgi:hypothetical protein|nr:hypothetical protein [Candidatus Hydrogenedens sp.]